MVCLWLNSDATIKIHSEQNITSPLTFVRNIRVVFFLQGKPWHISTGGKDTPGCGHTLASACQTMDWLLGDIFKHNGSINNGLFIETDTNLTLNNKLMVNTLPCLVTHIFVSVLIAEISWQFKIHAILVSGKTSLVRICFFCRSIQSEYKQASNVYLQQCFTFPASCASV